MSSLAASVEQPLGDRYVALAAGVPGVPGWSLADLNGAPAWTTAEPQPASPSPGSVHARRRYLERVEGRYGVQELGAWEARNPGTMMPRPAPEEGSNGSFWFKATLWCGAIRAAGLEDRDPRPCPLEYRHKCSGSQQICPGIYAFSERPCQLGWGCPKCHHPSHLDERLRPPLRRGYSGRAGRRARRSQEKQQEAGGGLPVGAVALESLE